jgi:hypothetical protein
MIRDALQWVAIIVELLGLTLIAIELYFPGLSGRLRVLLESSRPDPDDQFETARRLRSLLRWVGAYIGIWIAIVATLSLQDPAYSILANIALSIVTASILFAIWLSGLLVRTGVALGRGNSAGGVGFVLAVIGFAIEISQLILD